MSYQTKGTVFAVAKEATFNTAPTLQSTDVVQPTADSSFSPNVDSVERTVLRNSFVNLPSIATNFIGSGNLTFELLPDNDTNGGVSGDVVVEVGLGKVSRKGSDTGGFIGYSDAGTTPAPMIYMAQTGETGTADVYYLSTPADGNESLTVKQWVGGADKSVTYTGCVPNSIAMNFPVADICTIAADLGAANFATNESDTALAGTLNNAIPFVGKSATLVYTDEAGTAHNICVSNLSITVNNTVANVQTLCGTGYTESATTAKTVEGTFDILFEDFAYYTAMRNSEYGQLYLELTAGTSKFAVYLPNISITSADLGDQDGLVSQTVAFSAYEDANGTVILVGIE